MSTQAGGARTSAPSKRDGLERITVNLTPRAADALDRTVKLTGDSKTDSVNRALLVYCYLEEIMQSGGSVYLKPTQEAELERLHFF
jgi:hypothetical protein